MAKVITLKIIVDQTTAKKKATELTQEIVKLEKQQRNFNKILKEGTGDQKRAAGALAETKRRLTEKRKELRLTNNEITKQSYSLGGLRARNAQLRATLDQVNVSTRQGQKEFRRLSKEIATNQNRINKLDATTKRFQGNVGNYAGGITRSLKGIAAGFLGIYAAMRLVTGMFKKMAEFEKTFTNVITLLSEADKTKWGGLLKEQSAELIREFGFSIEETNKALFDAISAGIHVTEVYEYMRESAKLATGGVSKLSSVILGSTKIMNAYNLEGKESNKIMNALFTAQKFGQTTVELLSDSIGRVTSIGQQAQIPYQELLAVFAVLTKRLKNTEETATSMNAMIKALIAPTTQAKEAFNSLGIETGIMAVRNQGLFNILTKITQATGENADIMTELIPNIRAFKGIGALTTETLKEYDKILNEINTDYGEGSSLANAYSEQLKTTSHSVELLGGSWDNLIQTLSGSQGILKSTIDWLTKVVDSIAFISKYGLINATKEWRKEQEKINQTLIEQNKLLDYFAEESKRLEIDILEFLKQRKKGYEDANSIIKEQYKLEIDFIDELIKKFEEKIEQEAEAKEELTTIDEFVKHNQEEFEAWKIAREQYLLSRELFDLATRKKIKEDLKETEFELEEEEDIEDFDPALAREGLQAYLTQQYELYLYQQTADGERSILDKKLADNEISYKEYLDKIAALDEDAAAKKKKIEELMLKTKLELVSAGLGLIQSLTKRGSMVHKLAATAQTTIDTYAAAQASYKALAGIPYIGPVLGGIAAAAAVVSGLARVARINQITFSKGEILQGKSHEQGGIPFAIGGKTGFEAEGGEAIINKQSTALFRDELSAINSYKGYGKKFAEGGYVPFTPTPQGEITNNMIQDAIRESIEAVGAMKTYVVENEITSTQKHVQVIENEGDL